MAVTFTLLALSVCALWLGDAAEPRAWRRLAWLGLLAAAAVAGTLAGVVQGPGLLAILAFVALAGLYHRVVSAGPWRGIVAMALLVFAVALMLHRVPGFANPKVVDAVRFTPDAQPFTLHLNFDKTLVGLAMVGWGLPRLRRLADASAMLRVAVPIAVMTAVGLMLLSLAAGYVRWAPKFPAEAWLWLGVNLGFVCLAEEALFRGLIQTELQRRLAGQRYGAVAAVALAALLFGLAHAAGGVTYVLLATVAGLGYGWAYQRTGRIEAAMLVHWLVNTVHFLGFTYPALA